jgi:pimeloyl-ACP methyl ester carboxylesterase
MRRSLIATAIVTACLIAGCGGGDSGGATTTTTSADPSQPSTTEVSFQSGDFKLVGDLDLPAGAGPHPALVIVHSSGSQTRNSTPASGLVKTKFVDAGYVVLSYDKPGSGDSTGAFEEGFGNTQRATIVTDAIEFLKEQPSVDPNRIGVWGLSEAGWVMPKAMTMTDDISFMIVVNGGGEDSIEQMVYGWMQRARCAGASDEELALMDEHGAPALKAKTYAEYRQAMEPLLTIPSLGRYVGVTIELQAEEDWAPWPREIDSFFDPIEVIETTTIPVLAIFGAQDIQVDPVQGADAYRAALERAGNTGSIVAVIPDVGHTLLPSTNGCATQGSGLPDRYGELIDEWIGRLR